MFITVKVVVDAEGNSTRDCRSFDTLDAARSRYHSDLAKEIGAEGNSSVMCVILNEIGNVIINEYWKNEEA